MVTKLQKQSIPWAMAAGRAALGPILVVGEGCGWSGATLATLVMAALLSDIFDGVLARMWKCDTAAVRLFDSLADAIFYVGVALALWSRQPHLWHDQALLLTTVLMAELVNHLFSLVKFGKPVSYHSYLAKSWGLVLAAAVVSAFLSAHSTPLMPIALLLGVLSNVEGIAMSAMLRAWHRDVTSLPAAWRLRTADTAASPTRISGKPAAIATAIAVAGVCLFPTRIALAADTISASYAAGTATVPPQTPGTLNLASGSVLVFKSAAPNASSAEITIPYETIRRFEARRDVVRHLGVLPAVAVGLLAPRQRHYTVTISYGERADVQVATFELSEHDQRNLETVLQARAPKACAVVEYRPCLLPKSAQHNIPATASQPGTADVQLTHPQNSANTAQPQ